jgi:hypothetical protein
MVRISPRASCGRHQRSTFAQHHSGSSSAGRGLSAPTSGISLAGHEADARE